MVHVVNCRSHYVISIYWSHITIISSVKVELMVHRFLFKYRLKLGVIGIRPQLCPLIGMLFHAKKSHFHWAVNLPVHVNILLIKFDWTDQWISFQKMLLLSWLVIFGRIRPLHTRVKYCRSDPTELSSQQRVCLNSCRSKHTLEWLPWHVYL